MPKPSRRAVGEEGAAAGVGIEREIDGGKVEPLARRPVGADAAGLLVAGEQDDDVAIRAESPRRAGAAARW